MKGVKKPQPKKETTAELIRRKKAEFNMLPAEVKADPIVQETNQKDLKKISFLDKRTDTLDKIRNPEVYIKFIEFLVMPGTIDNIKTQGEFAKTFKMSETTLSMWKRRPGFWDEVREYRREFFKSDILRLATMALKKKLLTDPGAPEIKLAFQLADEFEEKSSVEVKKSTLTEEQKRGFAERLAKWNHENI